MPASSVARSCTRLLRKQASPLRLTSPVKCFKKACALPGSTSSNASFINQLYRPDAMAVKRECALGKIRNSTINTQGKSKIQHPTFKEDPSFKQAPRDRGFGV